MYVEHVHAHAHVHPYPHTHTHQESKGIHVISQEMLLRMPVLYLLVTLKPGNNSNIHQQIKEIMT